MANKIPTLAVEAAYDVAKQVFAGTITRAFGIKDLQKRFSLNESSASDMIDNLAHMLKGEQYERTINVFATDHFLEKIRLDFPHDVLEKAFSAVGQHLDYYGSLKNGSKQPAIRKILQKQRELAQKASESTEAGGLTAAQQNLFTEEQQLLQTSGEFDPNDIVDARKRIVSAIVRRQGQSAFRNQLLSLYQGRCAISDCEVEAVLEAAHIMPYKGPATHHPSNGLILRADLHTLFDLGLLVIDTGTMTVLVSPTLNDTSYQSYGGKQLRLPDEQVGHPSREALDKHREMSEHF